MIGWTSLRHCNRQLSNVVKFQMKNECSGYLDTPQLYAIETDFLTQNFNLPNEMNTRSICTSNVSCGGGEMVSGVTGGEQRPYTSSVISADYENNILHIQRECVFL